MPITKSAKKAIRVSDRKKVFNLRRKRASDFASAEVKKFVKAGKLKEAKEALRKAYQAIDKSAKGKTIKKNTASRKKSRLATLVKKSEK